MTSFGKSSGKSLEIIFVPVIIDCSCGCIVLYKAVALAIVFVLMEFYQNISLLKIFQTFQQNFNVT